MGIPLRWSWFAVFSCLLCMGCGVWCNCTEEGMQIEGGHYTLTKQMRRGSMMIYHCPENFYPFPALTRLCQLDGSWKPRPQRFKPQRCRIVECPDPNVLVEGNVLPPQEKYFVDNETTYECYTGYTMRGSSRRVCLPNGKWSGSTPICSRDSGANCADPGVPAGASRIGNVFGIDDTVKYSCNGKLFLVGSKERVCRESGQWTGKEPACYYKHTYDSPLEVSEAFGSAIEQSLATLDPLDETQEEKTIRILKNGTLNIYIALDISESINKTQLMDAKDAVTKLISKISSFTVTPNYEVLFFSSEIYKVVDIIDFFDGKMKHKDSVKQELDKFEVGDRNTAGTDLNLVFKTFLEQMAMIKTRVKEEAFKEHRHVIILFTDGGYNMGGSPKPNVERIKQMIYMNHTSEPGTQSREEFLDIYIFAIGAEIYDEDLQPLTAGIGLQHYFRLKDIKNLQKTFDEIIDEGDVKGLCGLHKEYDLEDSRESQRKMYPWWAYIVVQNQGTRRCLGSLVTPKFILTAAHCFKFGDLPEHITVEMDDGKHKAHRVKTYVLHPKYNINAKVMEGVAEFYDYDVALIQLEEYVQISSSIRRICIPGTQETSDALQLVGKSTLKQQEQQVLKNHLENLSFLTKVGSKIREKNVHAKLGDNREECISHALHAKGITTDNPKVAVTDNFLCTGGRTPFRDHIACSGDSGGAVFKNYEHRTIQVGLVSWGTHDLCKLEEVAESTDISRDFHVNLFRVVPFLKSVLANDAQDDFAPLQFLEN
ncbi:complement factor B [Pleuronectes platessa]|uniref:complement factor B n=1 Tax=Pleuronectes platessa TaxID=8262 RepID=UPI00232A37EF|nr:complement factor B [Pleuronectes platessa]